MTADLVWTQLLDLAARSYLDRNPASRPEDNGLFYGSRTEFTATAESIFEGEARRRVGAGLTEPMMRFNTLGPVKFGPEEDD